MATKGAYGSCRFAGGTTETAHANGQPRRTLGRKSIRRDRRSAHGGNAGCSAGTRQLLAVVPSGEREGESVGCAATAARAKRRFCRIPARLLTVAGMDE